MFPVSWTVVVVSLAVYAVIGMALGALTGFAVSFVLKLNFRGILEDTFLGSFGFVLGFIGAVFIPRHRNAITPDRVGFAVAIVLPVLHELYRFGCSKDTNRDY